MAHPSPGPSVQRRSLSSPAAERWNRVLLTMRLLSLFITPFLLIAFLILSYLAVVSCWYVSCRA